MIYKHVSSKEIIAKVITDLQLGDNDYSISDLREWILEGLESIGAFRQFNVKVTGKEDEPILEVSNYQVQLPNDFHKPVLIQYCDTINGNYIPLKWNTNPVAFRSTINNTSSSSSTTASSSVIELTMSLLNLNYEAALELVNTDNVWAGKMESLLVAMNKSTSTLITGDELTSSIKYTINHNYINLNVNSGYIRLVYLALPIDEDSYPLVPDLQSFRDALYWYITKKLYYPKWASGKIRDAVYYHAETNWNFHSKQSYAEAMMPDVGQLETIKTQWLKLLPEINSYNSSFVGLSEQEKFTVNV